MSDGTLLLYVRSPYHCPPTTPHPLSFVQAVNSDDCCTGVQLHEKITATITLLKWRGVSPNDRVLMTVPVSVDFYAIAIAVFAIGKWSMYLKKYIIIS